jgi:hypothetical protein
MEVEGRGRSAPMLARLETALAALSFDTADAAAA